MRYRTKGYFLFLYIIFVNAILASAQCTIEGTVVDTLSIPVGFVQVLAHRSDTKHLTNYSQADAQGRYKLTIHHPGVYTLTYKALGFRVEECEVNLLNDSASFSKEINVMLKEKPFVLNEVITYGERPITIIGDTVIYRIDAFTLGNEQIVEDVLRRLPGMDVSEDGIISFKGKTIEKVMVEGDDLFGYNYQVVNRTLHANMIDRVEAYERYSENPLLKNIEESERVALNLKLTDAAKLRIFGSVSGGYSTENDFDAGLNLMNFRPSVKTYLIGNANTIGQQLGYIPGLSRSFNPVALDKKQEVFQFQPDYLIKSSVYTPVFRNQRISLSEYYMGSLSNIINVNKKFKSTLVALYSQNNDDLNTYTKQTFWLNDSSLIIDEKQRYYKGLETLNFKNRFEYSPSQSTRIDLSGNIFFYTIQNSSYFSFSSIPIEDRLGQDNWNTDQSLEITHRINSKNALIIKGRGFYDSRNEMYSVVPVIFNHMFPSIESIREANQEVQSKTQTFSLSAENKIRLSRLSLLEIEGGGGHSLYHLNSQLILIDSLSNHFHADGYDGESEHRLRYAVGSVRLKCGLDSLRVGLGLTSFYVVFFGKPSLGTKQVVGLSPNVSLNWSISSKSKFGLGYDYITSPTPSEALHSAIVLNSYRSFTCGVLGFELFSRHNVSALYTYASLMQRDVLSIMLSYHHEPYYQTYNQHIHPWAQLTIDTLGRQRNMFVNMNHFDHMVHAWRTNFRLTNTNTFLRYSSYLFDVEQPVSMLLNSIGIEARSAFGSFFDFHLGYTVNTTSLSNSSAKRNYSSRLFTHLFFFQKESKNCQISMERFFFEGIQSKYNPTYFLDATFIWNILPSRLELKFTIRNLLNYTEYQNIHLTEISETISGYHLIPRYFMLSLNLRF